MGSVRAHSHTSCTPPSPFPPPLQSSVALPRGVQLLWLGAPAIPEGRNLSDTWHSLFQQTTAKSFPNPGLHYLEDQEAGAFPGQRWKRGKPSIPQPSKGHTANQGQLGKAGLFCRPTAVNTTYLYNPWGDWGELANWHFPSQEWGKKRSTLLSSPTGCWLGGGRGERVQLSLYNRSEKRAGKGRKRNKTCEQLHSPFPKDTKQQSPGNRRGWRAKREWERKQGNGKRSTPTTNLDRRGRKKENGGGGYTPRLQRAVTNQPAPT